MKAADFNAAMAMYAEADQRSTATLVELIAAAVLAKLNPPAKGGDVTDVTISPSDISEMLEHFHFDAQYAGEEMTIFLTPLALNGRK